LDVPKKPDGLENRLAICAWPLVVALAACAAIAPSLDGGFLNWDDDRFVVDNGHAGALTAENVSWAFCGVRFELYQPLALVSLMIDGSLWGGSPLGYRLHNLALFAACAALLFAVLRRLGFDRAPAAFGALLFAVAPYRAESVAWISSRKDLLLLLFGLAAWLAHLADAGTRRRLVVLRSLAALAFLAALLSKTGAVAWPAIMFAADLAIRRKGWRRSALLAAPYVLPAAAAAVAAPILWANAELLARPADPSVLGRLCLVGWTLAHYLGTALWPFALSPLYAEPGAAAQRMGAAIGAATSVALVVAIAVARARARGDAWRPWAAAVAVFAIGVAPYANAVPIYYVVADRYLLLPSLGLAVAASAAAARVAASERRAVRAIAVAAGLAVLVAFGIACGGEARAWRTSRSLWAHAVAREPDAFFARLKYGETLRDEGRPEESADQYREARRIRPGSPTALAGVFLGELLADADRLGLPAPAQEETVSRFLGAADDGVALLGLARDLERRGFTGAAAVARERFREWRAGAPPGP
jgi:protein O-mannosyl-transferase